MIALDVQSLCKRYGARPAIDELSFTVRAGELACLIGPNGAGKSTTMRILGGIQMADSGIVHVRGTPIADCEDAKVRCALTPQDVALFEYLTGVETLRLVAELRSVPDPGAVSATWLSTMGLFEVKDQLVRQYSGGMKRKLAVATALIHDPPVAVLDESFVGLDPESTATLRSVLRSYCDRGGAVLLSSHILEMVEVMADRVIVLRAGRGVGTFDRAQLDHLIPSTYRDLTAMYFALTQPSPKTGCATPP